MTRDHLQVDRRSLLRAASFLASIPADVGVVWATATGSDASSGAATGGRDGPEGPAVDGTLSGLRRPDGYAYGGAPVVAEAATADDTPSTASADAGDDSQGYGEYGYGGIVS